jgi:hypothetical protein
MKSYTMVITGKTGLPYLTHSFEIASDKMAKEYGHQQSLHIAGEKYYHFAIFHQEQDQQDLIADWEVKISTTLELISVMKGAA